MKHSAQATPGVPDRHRVSSRRADQWIVTCCDGAVYDELLVSFLGSLISVAQWDGHITVFDAGLTSAQVERLQKFGIEVESVPVRHMINLDRFLHLAGFAERHRGLIGQWDADVWFTHTVSDLFDSFRQTHGERIVCNLDRVFQQSCYWVAKEDPAIEARVRAILQSIIHTHGNVLQCGFVAGPSETMARFCRYQEQLIETGEYHPEWTSDTVGLNYFYFHFPDAVRLIDQRFNCLPDWSPRKEGTHFYLDERQMRVLHVTSPWRAMSDGDPFRFRTVHPELHERWREQLSA